jgi:CRP/FNR family cyclic AMP-dependent transcriptional regulator
MSATPRQDFLGVLDPKQRLRLSLDCPQRTLRRGSYLFLPGEPCDGLCIILTGRLKLSRIQESGRELTLGMVEAGELCGLECLQGLTERESSAQAMEDSRVMLIGRARLQKLLAEHPELSMALVAALGEKLRASQQVIERLLLKDVKARLAALLLDLASRCGQPAEDGIRLRARITHQELAGLIGSTRETTTATLNQFRRKRLIAVDRRQITIAAVDGLQRLAS